MPANALYVVGSILDRFLEGNTNLQEVRSNKILVAVPKPIKPETYNAINAARVTIGADIEILEMETPLVMQGWVSNGRATGKATGINELINQVAVHQFDALAIASPIQVNKDEAFHYLSGDGKVNPWGAIEALVSKRIASALNKPVAHAPVESDDAVNNPELFNILYHKVVHPRKAAEVISNCYLHCVLKGLHKAPRPGLFAQGRTIDRSSVMCLVAPAGCVGRPHQACFEAGIPVIAVEENDVGIVVDNRMIYVNNYLEAAGTIMAMKAGVSSASVRL
jgi:hypothetical protein